MDSEDTRFSNELTDAELERLAILAEELGEAQQCIGKIIRHGYESYNPVVDTGRTNRRDLEQELGDVLFAIMQMTGSRDISRAGIERRADEKAAKIKRYLHHQEEAVSEDSKPRKLVTCDSNPKPHNHVDARTRLGCVNPREIPIKEILPDGTIVNMTKKEAVKWRKSIKTKLHE